MPISIGDALDCLLEFAGSDLLISCGSPPRIRRDGVLEILPGATEDLVPADTEAMIRGLLDQGQLRDLESRRHVDFAFTWRGKVRMRGNAYYQRGSLAGGFPVVRLRIPPFW